MSMPQISTPRLNVTLRAKAVCVILTAGLGVSGGCCTIQTTDGTEIRRNLPVAREMLINGRLVEREILGTKTVDQLVSPSGILDGIRKTRLMRSLAAELWIRRVECVLSEAKKGGAATQQESA